jgi:uncharacterized protein (DUF305 family)
MNKKFLTLSGTTVAAAIALAGCSTGGGSTPGMSHSPSDTSTTSAPAATADHNAADTTFAQMMIPHHAQAVEMSDMILKKQNIRAEVSALATQIKAAQAPEIEKMTGWLNSWNESAAATADAHAGHSMNGMMSAEDMAKLEAAQGTAAAKLFLTQMIAHHQGAVMMAKTEESGGQNPEAVALSKAIITTQENEIQEMKDLLAKL